MWILWSKPPIAKLRWPPCFGNTANESETIGFNPTDRECRQDTLQTPVKRKQKLSTNAVHIPKNRQNHKIKRIRVWIVKPAWQKIRLLIVILSIHKEANLTTGGGLNCHLPNNNNTLRRSRSKNYNSIRHHPSSKTVSYASLGAATYETTTKKV